MNKTINKLIAFALGTLTIFTFGLAVALPGKAHAECFDEGGCDSSTYYNSYSSDNSSTTTSTTANPMPIVYTVTPSTVAVGTIVGNMAVVLTGANFVPGSLAEWNNSYRPTTYTDSGHLTVTLNASDLATVGSYVISIFNPMPGGGNSNGVYFTVSQAPTVATTTSTSSTTSYTTPSTTTTHTTTSTTPTTPPKTGTLSGSGANNGLSANASSASDSSGFMPSTFFEWFLAVLMIIAIVFLVRKAFFTEKFKSAPLKHA